MPSYFTAIEATNHGDPNEKYLFHGSTYISTIIRHGLDPRVCCLYGMIGGGVYFASKSTKSARYSQCCKPRDSGSMFLCRVSLGKEKVALMPYRSIRRPPQPWWGFPTEFMSWLKDQEFHSVYVVS